MTEQHGIEREAVISDCTRYRYLLLRTWDRGASKVGFIMLNPSTADATVDDPTIRRCMGYAQAWGYGGIAVGNLFALRATDPAALSSESAPIGPENDPYLLMVAERVDTVVCAWGTHGRLFHRDRAVMRLLAPHRAKLRRFDKKGRFPAHPLYLPTDLGIIPIDGNMEARMEAR